ncbi:MAG: 30S ribosomal protein S21 [Halobacteriovoraceae bacterium]|nr:30S ribosomal protein S21 [Halobacteriovoraceae bacterium]|tara:strand:- start:4216 stop:4431 length:216 start_codon:yes stop_codon:yes gene_type:complete
MQNIYISVDDRGVERSLRKFKRMCDSYGIVKMYRSRQEYKKPSIKAKEKQEAAEKRRRKTMFKNGRSRSKI